MTDQIFTFGYEGLSLKAFIARLKSAGIQTIIDVRANPLSRKPGFSKRALSSALHDAGIDYDHRPAMGCPKPIAIAIGAMAIGRPIRAAFWPTSKARMKR